jgi:hypothetical protein
MAAKITTHKVEISTLCKITFNFSLSDIRTSINVIIFFTVAGKTVMTVKDMVSDWMNYHCHSSSCSKV